MVKKPLRIVIDTNIYYSSLLYGGYPREIIILASQKYYLAVSSPEILLELRQLLDKKSDYSFNEINEIVKEIEEFSYIVTPKQKVVIVRHAADNKIIEAAISGNSDYIVTGDKDLLELKSYKGIKILNPKELLEVFTTIQ